MRRGVSIGEVCSNRFGRKVALLNAKSLDKYLIYAAAAVGAIAFYLWFQGAPADQPLFFLAPVAWLSGALSGLPVAFQAGLGYWGYTVTGLRIIIERSCSGGNFFVICFTLLAFTQVGRVKGTPMRLAVAVGALAASYVFTVLASSLRIAATVILLEAGLGFDPVLVHNIMGILTYVSVICLCYLVAQGLVSMLQNSRMVTEHGQ